MTPHSARAFRRRPGFRQALTLVLTLGTAATFGVVVYVASTSLPWFATSPTTDPFFGELNQCLLDSLALDRVGFAVSADGRSAAAYSGAELAVCTRAEGDAGPRAVGRKLSFEGVSSAAFDFEGTLWLSSERKGEGDPKLWRLSPGGAPERVGDFAPVALAGHAQGVVALDGSGRVVSLSAGGAALGFSQLPQPPTFGASLAVNSDGSFVSVVAGTGLFVYRTADLRAVLAEGPCEVEYLWWSKEPGQALVSCGPDGSWALDLQVSSGQKEAAPRRERVASALVPRLGTYVQPCEHLPCSAPAP